MQEYRVDVPVVRGVELPIGCISLVVTYDYWGIFGHVSKRQRFLDSRQAEHKYICGVNTICASHEFEEVGIYYTFCDGMLHLIERYNTCNGFVRAGEKV